MSVVKITTQTTQKHSNTSQFCKQMFNKLIRPQKETSGRNGQSNNPSLAISDLTRAVTFLFSFLLTVLS